MFLMFLTLLGSGCGCDSGLLGILRDATQSLTNTAGGSAYATFQQVHEVWTGLQSMASSI
jgi:hypothetical protein